MRPQNCTYASLLQAQIFRNILQVERICFVFKAQYDTIIIGKCFRCGIFINMNSIRKLVRVFASVIQDTAEAFCEADGRRRIFVIVPRIEDPSVRQFKVDISKVSCRKKTGLRNLRPALMGTL